MTDDQELIARLREGATWDDDIAAADRIEALLEQCEGLAQVVDYNWVKHQRVIAAEAKLAKAVEALDEAVYLLKPDEKDMMRQAGVYRIVTTLAEIKGESHE